MNYLHLIIERWHQAVVVNTCANQTNTFFQSHIAFGIKNHLANVDESNRSMFSRIFDRINCNSFWWLIWSIKIYQSFNHTYFYAPILTLCCLEFVLWAACFSSNYLNATIQTWKRMQNVVALFQNISILTTKQYSIESWMNRSNIISVESIPVIAWSILISLHKLNHFWGRFHLNIT